MQERLPDQALNEMFGWERLSVSLWNNTLIPFTYNEEKNNFFKNLQKIFSFLASFFLQWEFG